jgi:hypothetical protein
LPRIAGARDHLSLAHMIAPNGKSASRASSAILPLDPGDEPRTRSAPDLFANNSHLH